MDDHDLALLAGSVSTTLFVISYLPTLVKAFRTRDLTSYSLGNLLIANVGNAVHSVYVLSLPVGPIWFLHGFYLLSTGLMLFWYRRYTTRKDDDGRMRQSDGRGPDLPVRHGQTSPPSVSAEQDE